MAEEDTYMQAIIHKAFGTPEFAKKISINRLETDEIK